MADLSQIPTDQLVAMLGQHPAVQAAAPAPAPPDNGGLLKNLGAGFESAITSIPSAITDPASKLYEGFAPLLGLSPKSNPVPVGSITHGLNTALGPANPEKITANTPAERIARGVGAGLTGALIPGSEGYTVGQILSNAALGATSGAGAATGAEIAPDKYKPLVAFAGGILAPVAAVGAVNAVRAGYEAATAETPEIPTIADLNTAKKAAYAKVDNSTMKIAQPAVKNLYEGVKTKLEGMGLNEDTIGNLAPKTSTALDSLEKAAQGDQTLQGMEVQRRIAGLAAGAIDKTDRAAARIIQDHIDDFVGNLGPDQLSGPADQEALDALPQARDLAKRSFKAQTIQNIIDKANNNATGFSQSGLENSIRSGFRKLLNNDRGISRFSPDEQEAIKQVATGGSSLSATNLLRQVGKLSPQGAIPLLGEVAGVAAGGPQMLAIPAAGLAARAGATAMTKAAAQRALNLALSGGASTGQGATIGEILKAAASGASLQPPGIMPLLLGSKTTNDNLTSKVTP